MKNYLKVTYKDKPKNDYPDTLIYYLFQDPNSPIRDYITTLSHKPLNVLDLGCGLGDHLEPLEKYVGSTTGFDQCAPDPTICRRFKITLGDLNKPLKYEDNRFDVIFCKSVVEHLYYPEKLLAECYRILQYGGLIVILTPDYDAIEKVFFNDFTHRHPFTLKSLTEALEISEFKMAKSISFRQLPLLWECSCLNILSDLASIFYHKNTKNKFIKFSKEKMILGVGIK